MLKRFYIRMRPLYWIIRNRLMRVICYIVGCDIVHTYDYGHFWCNRCKANEYFGYPFFKYIEKEQSLCYKIKK